MKPAIRIDHLSKQYRLGSGGAGSQTFREAIMDCARFPWRRLRQPSERPAAGSKRRASSETMWALDDVSFEIQSGDVVGLIGRNGAGKSTLLKILSRVTEPSMGRVELRGRVGSLLEVGTGFHPELSGRENIYLNGAVLGISRRDIARQFDRIVEFAEVGRFLDTPVKRYSSGMYLRLAFAVAAHLESEILLVDEVLAVGDAAFQKKCLGKMGEVSRAGRTVVLVSHNMTAISSLCKTVIWLDQGRVVMADRADRTIGRYLQLGSTLTPSRVWLDPSDAPGTSEVRLQRVAIAPDGEAPTDAMTVLTPLALECDVWNFNAGAVLNVSVVLYNLDNVCIFNSFSTPAPVSGGLFRSRCLIPQGLLNDGAYRIRLLIVKDATIPLLDVENVATFEVQDVQRSSGWYGKFIGAVRPQLPWTTEILEPTGLVATTRAS